MSRDHVAIVTHGGASIGLGHVRRCTTLARALADQGVRVRFHLGPEAGVAEIVERHGFDAARAPELRGNVLHAALANAAPSAIVADSYRLAADDLLALRRLAPVAVLDDLADRELPVDLVWNGAPQAAPDRYRGSVGAETRLLLGPRYALLAPEYVDLPERRPRVTVERVLVTVGAADPTGALERLVAAVCAALPGIAIDAVAGPLAPAAPLAVAPGVTLHRAPSSLVGLMQAADLAVSAGGQTLYELAATGTPTVAVWTADNQRPQLLALAERGAIAQAGDARAATGPGRLLQSLVARLAANAGARRSMSEIARGLLDGRGAARTARAILEL